MFGRVREGLPGHHEIMYLVEIYISNLGPIMTQNKFHDFLYRSPIFVFELQPVAVGGIAGYCSIVGGECDHLCI